MRRGRRHPAVVVQVVLCAIALAMCGALYALTLGEPVPAGTGDPLVDAALEEYSASQLGSGYESYGNATLPVEWFEERIPRYGTDFKPPTPSLEVLERGNKSAGADPALLLDLLLGLHYHWIKKAEIKLDLPVGITPEEKRVRRITIAAEAFRKHHAEHERIAGQLLGSHGEEAVVHYTLAGLAAQRGDCDMALAHVRLGNTAPGTDSLEGPVERARSRMLAGPNPDPLTVALLNHLSQPRSIWTHDIINSCVPAAALRHDAEALDACAAMLLRRNEAELGGNAIGSLTAQSKHLRIAGHVQSNWPQRIDAALAAVIAELNSQQDVLRKAIRAVPETPEPGPVSGALLSVRDVMSGFRHKALLSLQQQGQSSIDSHHIIDQHMPQYIERAREFSYR
jgi:hypothetical protein